jgi:hypothetical protein
VCNLLASYSSLLCSHGQRRIITWLCHTGRRQLAVCATSCAARQSLCNISSGLVRWLRTLLEVGTLLLPWNMYSKHYMQCSFILLPAPSCVVQDVSLCAAAHSWVQACWDAYAVCYDSLCSIARDTATLLRDKHTSCNQWAVVLMDLAAPLTYAPFWAQSCGHHPAALMICLCCTYAACCRCCAAGAWRATAGCAARLRATPAWLRSLHPSAAVWGATTLRGTAAIRPIR